MEQLQYLNQSEVLDIAFQAVRLYAETHPRPIHVTQGQAAEMLGITMDALVRKMAAKKIRLNECGMIPMPDIDLIIASRIRRHLYEAPKPVEAAPPTDLVKPASPLGDDTPRRKRARSATPGGPWMRIVEVEEMAGVKTSAIYSWVKNGSFPKPIKVGRTSQWVRAEVEAWVDQQRAKRNAAGNWL
ncbi:helix-turn-helix transcriptional regulator [Quatrionicoccus australiensis]|uniref:helix-turn-helix transcriptional regulator n=1 Tax=Quatrionicoccus australiensis TaxID=138118 RepID=UPI001CFB12E5|nr:AlpA family phage regulatory protein [Quatrionicoccus australiensis]MCB4360905.1 AlpA family phage regulatory protein [Quatrionicoccus australiensis]